MVLAGPSLRQWCVEAPFTDANLAKIGPDTLTVMVPYDLDADTYVKVANAMVKAPKAMVRLWQHGTDETIRSVVQFFRHVERISLQSACAAELLREFSPNLRMLSWKIEESSNVEEVKRFQSLELLYLDGQSRVLSTFPSLANLRALHLSRINLKNLELLTSLQNLQSLRISESSLADLSALHKVGNLKYLDLSNLPKLTGLENLQLSENLEFLSLSSLKNVDKIPSLKTLKALRRLSITGLKNLVDLSSIAKAPNLEELILFDMNHLTPLDVQVLKRATVLKPFARITRKSKRLSDYPVPGRVACLSLTKLLRPPLNRVRCAK